MAVDCEAQHVALHPPVKALRKTIGLWRVGPCDPMLHLQLATGALKAIGGKARAPVGEHVRDLERESADRLLEEGDRTLRRFILLDSQMHPARAAVDGHIEIAFAALAIRRSELGQVLDVYVHETEIVVLEGAALPLAVEGWRQAPQPVGLENAVDRVAVEMRQEVTDHKGE